jgi:valyl-tRNA synthetase
VTDPHGQKMSKSKGNVVSPQAVLEKYSADAIRFWAAGAKLGDDIPYQEKELVTGKKTVTKLWNASRFALANLEGYDGTRPQKLALMDRWLLDKADALVRECTNAFDAFDHSKAKFAVEQFFWRVMCDDYLEIIKGRLYEPKSPDEKRSAQHTLLAALERILSLFAPFLPFVTEEIWHHMPIASKAKSVHVSAWPAADAAMQDAFARSAGDEVAMVVAAVRKHKSERQLAMNAPLQKLHIITAHDLAPAHHDLLSVTRAQELTYERGEFGVRII